MLLDTDASNVGVGAVLSQLDPEGKEWVLGYASRTLNRLENFSVTRQELLAIIFGVEGEGAGGPDGEMEPGVGILQIPGDPLPREAPWQC